MKNEVRHPEKVKKLAVTGANLRSDTSAVGPTVYGFVQPMFANMKKSKDTSARFRTAFKLFRMPKNLTTRWMISSSSLTGRSKGKGAFFRPEVWSDQRLAGSGLTGADP
ncbi:MAG TPA: hypothetical protein VK563_21060 [Puia sp.]|nr:hypothetical protein [Puia sp.]